MKRLLPSIVILTLLMGCAQFDRFRTSPPRRAAEAPKSPIEIGMSGLHVVKTIGFPISGARLSDCDGARRDVWVYNDGNLLLLFTDGQLSGIVGPGGDRPSIRLYR